MCDEVVPCSFERCSGDCDLCGRWDSHLIEGACAGCANRYKLTTNRAEELDALVRESQYDSPRECDLRMLPGKPRL